MEIKNCDEVLENIKNELKLNEKKNEQLIQKYEKGINFDYEDLALRIRQSEHTINDLSILEDYTNKIFCPYCLNKIDRDKIQQCKKLQEDILKINNMTLKRLIKIQDLAYKNYLKKEMKKNA